MEGQHTQPEGLFSIHQVQQVGPKACSCHTWWSICTVKSNKSAEARWMIRWSTIIKKTYTTSRERKTTRSAALATFADWRCLYFSQVWKRCQTLAEVTSAVLSTKDWKKDIFFNRHSLCIKEQVDSWKLHYCDDIQQSHGNQSLKRHEIQPQVWQQIVI